MFSQDFEDADYFPFYWIHLCRHMRDLADAQSCTPLSKAHNRSTDILYSNTTANQPPTSYYIGERTECDFEPWSVCAFLYKPKIRPHSADHKGQRSDGIVYDLSDRLDVIEH